MKSYYDLVKETLDQRAIIDNRNIVSLSETSNSVLIAFNQACEYMRDLHNWKWKKVEDVYLNDLGQETYPIPYGIVEKVFYKKDSATKMCELEYVDILTADTICPTQWSFKWDTEEIQIAPATSTACDSVSTTTIMYADNNIATLGVRTAVGATKLQRFDLTLDTSNQYLNVPEYIYDAYARCVILKTRVFLNENAQTTLFPAQQQEWLEAYNGLMSYAKTPFYTSEKTVI